MSALAQLARRFAVVTTGATLVAATCLAAVPAGATAVTPGWQPDPNDLGPVALYDAAGHKVVSGSTTASPMVAYYVLPGAPAATQGYVADSTPEKSNSGTWSGTNQITSTQTFPKASLPGDLAGFTGPVVADDSGQSLKQNQIDTFPNAFTSADPTYQNLYEIRFYVGTGTSSWYDADVVVSGTTWTQVYPAVSASTVPGAPTIGTATAGDGSVSVAFTAPASDGGSAITGYTATSTPGGLTATGAGSPITVPGLTNGTSYTFTVHATNSMGGSAESGSSAAVTPRPATTTVLSSTVISPQPQGTAVPLTATVTATDASAPTGSVQFKDGVTNIGAPVPVVAGAGQSTAAQSWTSSTIGAHSLSAVFAPTPSTAYAPSTGTSSYAISAATPQWKATLYGTVRVGSTVACVASFDYATAVTYSWLSDGHAIAGATAASYKIPDALYNHLLSCALVATNSGGPSVSGSSSQVKMAIGPALVVTTRPYLFNKNSTHITTHGTYEYVTNGGWSPAGTSYTYQWYYGTTAIRGATSYRYAIPAILIGRTINCVVTAHRAAWTNGVYRTAAVKVMK